jgi:hypothetical protein
MLMAICQVKLNFSQSCGSFSGYMLHHSASVKTKTSFYASVPPVPLKERFG